MRATILAATLLAIGSQVPAQETEAPAPTPATESREAAPRPHIRVLQDPYGLASFYRSGGSAPGGWAGLSGDPAYAIADAYRTGQGPYGWSAFWAHGYAAPRRAPFLGYRRTIGENGDLFLMVPFLAPVGPLNGAFFGY
jgi:hypothetical protein